MTVGGFKELLVWRQGIALVQEAYALTADYPRSEQFGLTSQMRRAAVAIPANIAEESGRGTRKDFQQFLRIALGSLRGLETYLVLAVELGYSSEERLAGCLPGVGSVGRLLQRLIESLDVKAPTSDIVRELQALYGEEDQCSTDDEEVGHIVPT